MFNHCRTCRNTERFVARRSEQTLPRGFLYDSAFDLTLCRRRVPPPRALPRFVQFSAMQNPQRGIQVMQHGHRHGPQGQKDSRRIILTFDPFPTRQSAQRWTFVSVQITAGLNEAIRELQSAVFDWRD